jgi:adhesin transport system membrane fusion protein
MQRKKPGLLDRLAGGGGRTVAEKGQKGPQVKRASLVLLWSITLIFLVLSVWIAVAEVDTVTRAEGRVMPSAKMQVLQNLEGGIVAAILVKQGESVAQGQSLVRLSDVQLRADQKARMQQILGLEARSAKLLGIAGNKPPEFPASVKAMAPDLMSAEQAGYLSKKLELEAQLGVLDAQIEQKKRELDEASIALKSAQKGLVFGKQERATIALLVERGLEPRLELVRADRALTEQEGRAESMAAVLEKVRSGIQEAMAKKDSLVRQSRSEALVELNRTLAELSPLKQAMPAIDDRLARTDIQAPMKGVVNRIFVNTIGGIVKPGEAMLEVVPGDDQLVIDALVSPKDIGFVKIGQLAHVKITAYDYSIFGGMEGVVQNISADAVPNEKGEAFYQVRIDTKTKAIEVIDKKLPIMPGMQAQVDIITGKKTILQFLSKPLVAMKENAFRER